MNHWVIGDVHGCSKSLKALIEKQIKADPSKDLLNFVGDFIDRGPDSRGVIDYLMELESLGFTLKAVRGNHEEMFLKAYQNPQSLDAELYLKNYGAKATLKSFQTEDIASIDKSYINWLDSLPYFIEFDTFFLVHAGFNFNCKDIFSDRDAMITIRRWYDDVIPDMVHNKLIVHGHTPIPKSELEAMNENSKSCALNLDTGCVYALSGREGVLTAVELKQRKLYFQSNIDHYG